MGEFSPLHWILVIAIALLLFGTGKFVAVGKGIGEGIRNFKSAMKPEEGLSGCGKTITCHFEQSEKSRSENKGIARFLVA